MRSPFTGCRAAACVLIVSLCWPVWLRAQDRMPPIPADKMTPEQRQAVAEFKAARKADINGPFVPLLRSPEVMTRARQMGDYLRFKSVLPARLSEFVILITSREWTQQFEWNTHYRIALDAGVKPEVASALAEGRRPPQMNEEEQILYDLCFELERNRSVSDATYARAVSRFGEQGVIDAVGIVGYYTMLAMVMNTTRTPLPSGVAAPLAAFPR
jgi:4-carboxymuconolactone decarboxylase